jgi:hypothetical protein
MPGPLREQLVGPCSGPSFGVREGLQAAMETLRRRDR